MKIKVECESAGKNTGNPIRFIMGSRPVEVAQLVDRWYGENASYFRVLGNDENLYILKGPTAEGDWDLVSFTHKDSRGTELEFEGRKELQ